MQEKESMICENWEDRQICPLGSGFGIMRQNQELIIKKDFFKLFNSSSYPK